mgnify:CR=1 FL=1
MALCSKYNLLLGSISSSFLFIFNDSLDLEFLSDRVGGVTNLQIFNRFGTIIYEQANYVNQWNGQDNSGNELPTGTYYYVIDLASVDDVYGSQTSGWIYLNRSSN